MKLENREDEIGDLRERIQKLTVEKERVVRERNEALDRIIELENSLERAKEEGLGEGIQRLVPPRAD